MAKVTLGVKTEQRMKDKLRYIAKVKGVGYADHVRFALMKDIDDYEKKHGIIDNVLINQIKIEESVENDKK